MKKLVAILFSVIATLLLTACSPKDTGTKFKGVAVNQDYQTALIELKKAGCVMQNQNPVSMCFSCDFCGKQCAGRVDMDTDDSVKAIRIEFPTDEEERNADFMAYLKQEYDQKYGEGHESFAYSRLENDYFKQIKYDLIDATILIFYSIPLIQVSVEYTPKHIQVGNFQEEI